MSNFERLFEALLDGWSNSTRQPSRTHSIFGLLLVTLCATVFFIGAVPTYIYGHDDFLLLENGWRAIHGQRPQLDYWSPWGPVISLVMAFGLKMAHESANGIGEANAVLALLVGTWAYWLGCKRLDAMPRVLYALCAALLVCAPYSLGESPLLSSHAMTYNRYGYAFVSLVLLECMPLRRTTIGEADEWAGGISTGVAMAVTLFLKASFFGACVLLVGGSLLFERRVSRLLGWLSGLGLAGIAFMAYLRFDFVDVIAAMRAAAGARSMALSLVNVWWTIRTNVSTLASLAMLGIGAALLKRGAKSWIEAIQWPGMVVVVYVCDIVLLSTNAQKFVLPLLSMTGLLVAGYLAECRQQSTRTELLGNLPFHTMLLTLCGFLFFPSFISDARGVMVGARDKAHPSLQACGVRFTEPRLSDLILCDHPDVRPRESNGATYTTAVNDGAKLLHEHGGPTDKVLTMDMQNPFPFSLGWPPTTGGMTSTAYNFTFSKRFRPTASQYFGDTTIVMVPKSPAIGREFFDGLMEIYSPDLLQRYELAAESKSWRLYRIKQER